MTAFKQITSKIVTDKVWAIEAEMVFEYEPDVPVLEILCWWTETGEIFPMENGEPLTMDKVLNKIRNHYRHPGVQLKKLNVRVKDNHQIIEQIQKNIDNDGMYLFSNYKMIKNYIQTSKEKNNLEKHVLAGQNKSKIIKV